MKRASMLVAAMTCALLLPVTANAATFVPDPRHPIAKNQLELDFIKILAKDCKALRRTGGSFLVSNGTSIQFPGKASSYGPNVAPIKNRAGKVVYEFGDDLALCLPYDRDWALRKFPKSSAAGAEHKFTQLSRSVFRWQGHFQSASLMNSDYLIVGGTVKHVVFNKLGYSISYGKTVPKSSKPTSVNLTN